VQRAPLLERLIAQASVSLCDTDWRTEAFHAIVPPDTSVPSIAATALHASVGPTTGAWVCVATPVHLVAGMTNVTMPDDGIVEPSRGEAEALAADFNRVFSDAGLRLVVGRSALLLCVFDRALEVTTRDPEDVVGRDVFGCQPAGADASRLRQLMSEMEMWLFDHLVNRARAARSLPPITGLWLWGGGATLAAMPTVQGWTAGRDPLFAAFGAETEFPSGAGAGVVICAEQPSSPGWLDVETRWLEPAMAGLRSGRIGRLVLSAGDRRFNVDRGINWRFWRRSRPWWESFDGEGGESNGIQ
jgi:hypothetical protein